MSVYLSVHISDTCMYLMYTADDNQLLFMRTPVLQSDSRSWHDGHDRLQRSTRSTRSHSFHIQIYGLLSAQIVMMVTQAQVNYSQDRLVIMPVNFSVEDLDLGLPRRMLPSFCYDNSVRHYVRDGIVMCTDTWMITSYEWRSLGTYDHQDRLKL